MNDRYKIELVFGTNTLLIKVSECELLTPDEALELTGFIEMEWSKIPLDCFEMIMVINQLDDEFKCSSLFVKRGNEAAMISGIIVGNVLSAIKLTLARALNLLHEGLGTGLTVEEFDFGSRQKMVGDLGPITGDINADAIIKEMDEAEKKKKRKRRDKS